MQEQVRRLRKKGAKRRVEEGSQLVVNDDYTCEALKRVGRLLSAEIDHAALLILPAMFIFYMAYSLEEIIRDEPDTLIFWKRWFFQDEQNPPTEIVFHDLRAPTETCLRQVVTPDLGHGRSLSQTCSNSNSEFGKTTTVLWLAAAIGLIISLVLVFCVKFIFTAVIGAFKSCHRKLRKSEPFRNYLVRREHRRRIHDAIGQEDLLDGD